MSYLLCRFTVVLAHPLVSRKIVGGCDLERALATGPLGRRAPDNERIEAARAVGMA